MSTKLANLRATIEAMTGGDWEVNFDRNDQANIFVRGQPTDWIALLPHQCLGSIEEEQKLNAAGIVALHRSRLALLTLADAVGRLAAYEDNELTSEQFEERLNATVDAYRRLLESIP